MAIPTFTPEEIASMSMGNAEGLFLSTISYMKSQGYDLEKWLQYVGNQYAASWDNLEDKGAAAVARAAALNWISCGAELVSSSGDENSAEAILKWPSDDSAKFFGVSKSDAHQVNNVFIPIAEKAGTRFSWESDGDLFTLRFSK